MTRHLTLTIVAVLALGACGLKENVVVVLPEADGRVGSVVVTPRTGGPPAVLDRAFAAAQASPGGTVEAVDVEQGQVVQIFGAALGARPTPAVSFTLYFREGTDILTPNSAPVLQEIFAEIRRRPVVEVVAIGHTDRVGQIRDNDELSRRRAERTRQLLIEQGVPTDLIQSAGRGEREPLVPTADEVAEPRNRRVEISIR